MNLGMGEDPPLRKGGKGGNVEGVDRYRRQPCAGLRGRLPPPHKKNLKDRKKRRLSGKVSNDMQLN